MNFHLQISILEVQVLCFTILKWEINNEMDQKRLQKDNRFSHSKSFQQHRKFRIQNFMTNCH